MELGSWSIIQAPSLLALIPLVVMIVLIFRGKSNVSAIMVGVLVGALLLGQDLGAMAKAFATSLGSSTALIGLIIMMGAGLGVLMSEAGVTPTVVATLFKVAGEIGLILGPLTGVTLITMEVTGLSYGELMIQAAIPFAVFWLAGAWVGANRAQNAPSARRAMPWGRTCSTWIRWSSPPVRSGPRSLS